MCLKSVGCFRPTVYNGLLVDSGTKNIGNSDTVWHKILTGENIDEIDEFLSIRQHFPYQNFPLIISSAVCMPDNFFVQGVIASYIIAIRAHAIFSLSMQIYQIEKQCRSIAMRTTTRIPNSKVAPYIASN